MVRDLSSAYGLTCLMVSGVGFAHGLEFELPAKLRICAMLEISVANMVRI